MTSSFNYRIRVLLFLQAISLLISCVARADVLLTDDFESYAVGTWPSANWVTDANAIDDPSNNLIVSSPGGRTGQSLKLFGQIGGCWAAIGYHQLTPPAAFDLEFDVYNGSETLSGCHPGRATVELKQGTHWYNYTRGLVDFWGDGNIRNGDVVLGQFQTLQWYHVKIAYRRSGNQLALSYWLDGQYLGEVDTTIANASQEDSLDHLDVTAEEGSVWFDNILVTLADNQSVCHSVPGDASSGVSFGNVVAGQTYTYSASGCIYMGGPSWASTDPDGNLYTNCTTFIQKMPPAVDKICDGLTTFSLVAKVANTYCIQLGTSGSFVAPASGELTLYYNDGISFFGDNSGSFDVCITPPDADGDGVPDSLDQCPNTPPGAIVNSNGCSIAQLVPCAGPLSGGTWRNHGEYLFNVIKTATDFLKANLISRREWAVIVSRAARSKCGWNSRWDHGWDRDWNRDWDWDHDRGWNRGVSG